MARLLALVALATVTAGCRESIERRFIYYPSRPLAADPSSVGLPFRDVAFTAADGVRLHGWLIPGRTPTTPLYSPGNARHISGRPAPARAAPDAAQRRGRDDSVRAGPRAVRRRARTQDLLHDPGRAPLRHAGDVARVLGRLARVPRHGRARAGRAMTYGSDLVVDLLRAVGVEHVAINPGATFRGLHDSLVNHGKGDPERILTLHAEIAVPLAPPYPTPKAPPMAAPVPHPLRRPPRRAPPTRARAGWSRRAFH